MKYSVLRRTGLLAASFIVREDSDCLITLPDVTKEDVPANQILRTCYEAKDGARPSLDWKRARGRLTITWIHQICRDTGISVTDALQLACRRSLVLATNRNGGMLRLNASRHGDDDEGL